MNVLLLLRSIKVTNIPDMKKFIASIFVALSVIASISCERHTWEDSSEDTKDGVKNLFHADESYGSDDSKAKKSDHSDDKH